MGENLIEEQTTLWQQAGQQAAGIYSLLTAPVKALHLPLPSPKHLAELPTNASELHFANYSKLTGQLSLL
jgi:hypothetical protein